MDIFKRIGCFHRGLRITILFSVLIFECAGTAIIWVVLPFEEAVRAAVVIPISLPVLTVSVLYMWRQLGYLCVDDEPFECMRLPGNQRVPSMHIWKISFNLRNPTRWDAIVLSCTAAYKHIKWNELIDEDCKVIDGPTVPRRGLREIRMLFQCCQHEGPCKSRGSMNIHIEYAIGGGMKREDEYVRFIRIG